MGSLKFSGAELRFRLSTEEFLAVQKGKELEVRTPISKKDFSFSVVALDDEEYMSVQWGEDYNSLQLRVNTQRLHEFGETLPRRDGLSVCVEGTTIILEVDLKKKYRS